MMYNDVTENPAIEPLEVADRLPELNDRQIQHAHAPDQVKWAYQQLSQGVGYVWDMPEIGIAMQVSSVKSMRVLNVVDHDFPMLMLACIKRTLNLLGMDLEMDTALVIPYEEAPPIGSNDGPTEAMEDIFIEVV